MKLSIVATLYQSAIYINDFCERVTASAQELVGEDYEIILVNDGSPDNSLDIAIQLHQQDEHVMVIDLSRNFGHHKAMIAGLEHASGERIFLIDSDLEEDPEWLLDFSRQMFEEKADVVYGRQRRRKGSWFERWSGNIFYTIFNWLVEIEHPRNIVTARLMTRQYVDALLRYREHEMVISCLWVITGFKQVERMVDKHGESESSYNFFKKIRHVTNGVTSFSEVPLKLIFYIGSFIFLGAMTYVVSLVYNKIFLSRPIEGWTTVVVSIWLLGGLVISFIGVLGIYLSKIFIETKRRPNYIVRSIYGKEKK
jgi:putative glycosyltransferase